MNIQAIKKNVRAGHRVAVQWHGDGKTHYLLHINDDGNFLIFEDEFSITNWIDGNRLNKHYHNPQIVPYEDLEVEVGDEVVFPDKTIKKIDCMYRDTAGFKEGNHYEYVNIDGLVLNMEDKKLDLSDEQLLEEIRKRGLVKDGEVIK